MSRQLRRLLWISGIALLGLTPALAAEVVQGEAPPRYTEGLHGVDFTGLSEEQKQLALDLLNELPCDCGCGMTVAQCRVEDQSCPRSPVLAREIVDAIRRGGDAEAARAAYEAARRGNRSLEFQETAAFEIDTGDSPARGAATAPVTIVEFADFQCPLSARAVPTLRQVLAAYPDQVRLVFKHFPLAIHPAARRAAIAAEAAREQGKFWEMYDLLFQNPASLERADLVAHAASLGLDVARFEKDLDSAELAARVDRDAAEAMRVGATATPTFFVNGRRMESYQLNAFRAAIRNALTEEAPGSDSGH
ncbi:MAG: thioredoxin domain-containing protein [Acidobacteriota bacterium]|jgi:predicted DsbA family dithiol-disulfide isomerase